MELTAITRKESKSVIPDGIKVAKVDYADQSSLVAALRGQEVLVITMNPRESEAQGKLIEAAAAAEVPWVLPNEFGFDPSEKTLGREAFLGPVQDAARKKIEDLGKSAWIGFCCSFWYEFSLAGTEDRYGFDFKNKSLILYDDGDVKINTSTWPQCGRAIANLLALKVLPDDPKDTSPCLSQFKFQTVYISSFLVSQKDMFESVLRVTGGKADDWTIRHQDSAQRYKEGVEAFQRGDLKGFGRAMYVRGFYPDGSGNYESRRTLDNDILGLPKEDLDEYTKIAIDMAAAQI
jgi:NmrA-like family